MQLLKLQAHNLQNTVFWDVMVHTLVENDEYKKCCLYLQEETVSLARKNCGGYKERGKGQLGIKKEIQVNTSRICIQFKVASFSQKLITKTK